MNSAWRSMSSPFARLHARGALLVYLGLRVFAVFVFGMASVPFADWVSGDKLFTFVVLTVLLAELELRRAGTTALFDNIGLGGRQRLLLVAIPAMLGELVLLVAWPAHG